MTDGRDRADFGPATLGWTRLLVSVGARSVLLVVAGMMLWGVLPVLVGWQSTTVVSGSMQPRILAGDLVVVRPVDPALLRPGQVLLARDPDHQGRLRLHRFVESTPSGDLVLRGDANASPDSSPVRPSDVQGVAVLRVPHVGLPVLWAKQQDWTRLLVLATAVALLLAGSRLGTVAPTSPLTARPSLVCRMRRRARLVPSRARFATAAATVSLVALTLAPPPGHAAWAATTGNSGNTLAAGSLAPVTGLAAAVTCPPSPVVGTGTATLSGGKVAITVPSSVQAGDVLVFAVSWSNAFTVVPGGLTQLRTDAAGGQFDTTVYQRVATAADAGAVYSWTTSGQAAGGLVVVRGATGLSLVAETSGQGTQTNGTLLTAPSITAGAPNSLMVMMVAAKVNTTYSYPSSMSPQYALAQSSISVGGASELIAASGATGSRTATAANQGAWTAQAVLLRLASPSATQPAVALTWTPTTSGYASSYTVTRDSAPVATVTPVSTATWTDSGVTNGSHTWTVTTVADSWVSPPASTSATVSCP